MLVTEILEAFALGYASAAAIVVLAIFARKGRG